MKKVDTSSSSTKTKDRICTPLVGTVSSSSLSLYLLLLIVLGVSYSYCCCCVVYVNSYMIIQQPQQHQSRLVSSNNNKYRSSLLLYDNNSKCSNDNVVVDNNNNNTTSNVYMITGANGYVGRAVVQELLYHHHHHHRYIDTEETESNSVTKTASVVTMIICLVRSHHVQSEQIYWNQQLERIQQQQRIQSTSLKTTTNNTGVSIYVLPYDMCDDGTTFHDALQLVLQIMQQEKQLQSNWNGIQLLCVYHIASIFGPTKDYIQTAYNNINGTINLLHTLGRTMSNNNNNITKMMHCTSTNNKCKFILTSSMAAVRGTGQLPKNTLYYTSQDWNTCNPNQFETTNTTTTTTTLSWGMYYQWSKMESERQAWELCRSPLYQDTIDMIALCPSFVFGPPTIGTTTESSCLPSSYSITLVNQWIHGTAPVQSRLYIDIRDVAKAHVMASINHNAIGQRIILSTETRIPSSIIASWIQDEIRNKQQQQQKEYINVDKIYYDAEFQGGSIPIGNKEVDAT